MTSFNQTIRDLMDADGFIQAPSDLEDTYNSCLIVEKYWKTKPPYECSITLSHELIIDLVGRVLELETTVDQLLKHLDLQWAKCSPK